MTPSATAAIRRLAGAALTAAVLVPVAGGLAAPAYAEDAPPSATPTVDIGEPAYAEADPAPAAEPSPRWITGGTLQESQAGPPAAAPAPVARRATVKAPVARRQTVVRPGSPTRPEGPTALPFTGPGRLAVQLGIGGALVLLGAGLTAAAIRTSPRSTA